MNNVRGNFCTGTKFRKKFWVSQRDLHPGHYRVPLSGSVDMEAPYNNLNEFKFVDSISEIEILLPRPAFQFYFLKSSFDNVTCYIRPFWIHHTAFIER